MTTTETITEERQLPTLDQIRDRIADWMEEKGIWCGAPLPIDHLRLVIEPKYPYQGLHGAKLDHDEPKPQLSPEDKKVTDDIVIRNTWRSQSKQGTVYVWAKPGHGAQAMFWPDAGYTERLTFAINTLGASEAWSSEAELTALVKLRDHVGKHKFHQYLTTGSFLETSPRSKVTYLFRKCRPTLALRPNSQDNMRVIAALCLHPVGFYESSWAGCMAPSDCVIAHLLLMRADEHGYWKRSNQHRPWTPEAGI